VADRDRVAALPVAEADTIDLDAADRSKAIHAVYQTFRYQRVRMCLAVSGNT
jgi:hypothetical protein